MHSARKQISGFSLIEMVVVIVITAIIGGTLAIFLRVPVQGYVDSARRAELTDIADTALRRMGRDVRTAVPNSVRLPVPTGATYVEFIPTKDGGRYRADAPGNTLDFGVADGSFDIVGSPITFAAGDYIVVGSTQSSGNPPYDTTLAGVLRAYSGAAGAQSSVTITNAVGLPAWAELPSQRFAVVDGAQQAVTYSCEGTLGTLDATGNGQALLVRHWAYGYNPSQKAPAALGGSSAILANSVSGCAIDYELPNQRFGLLAVRLTLTRGGESVSLYNEIHVNNMP